VLNNVTMDFMVKLIFKFVYNAIKSVKFVVIYILAMFVKGRIIPVVNFSEYYILYDR